MIKYFFNFQILIHAAALVIAQQCIAQTLNPTWTLDSNGASEEWIPRHIALGNQGYDITTQIVGADQYRRVYSYGSNTPVYQSSDDIVTLRARVASAPNHAVQAFLRDQRIPGSSPVLYEVVLKVRINDATLFPPGGAPQLPLIKDYIFPATDLSNGDDKYALTFSPDGRKLAAIYYNGMIGKNVAFIYDILSDNPPSRFELPMFFPLLTKARFIHNGTQLFVGSQVGMAIIDANTGATIFNAFESGYVNDYDTTESGNIIFMATDVNGIPQVRARIPGSTYIYAWRHILPTGTYCPNAAISSDGLKAAATCVTLSGSIRTLTTYFYDMPQSIANGAPVIVNQRSFSSAADPFPLNGKQLEYSKDGSVLVVSMSGDAGLSNVPEVALWEGSGNSLIGEIQLPGSPQVINISNDGKKLLVGSKNGHDQQWVAWGGQINLYDLSPRDLIYTGIARRGQTINITVKGAANKQASTILASSLAPVPIVRPPLGTIYIDRRSIQEIIPMGTTNSAGEAHLQYTIPANATAGSTVYLQGATLAPLRLTQSWLKFTIED